MARRKGTASTRYSAQVRAIRRHRYELAQRTTAPSRRDFTAPTVRVGQTIRQIIKGGVRGLAWAL